MKNSTFLPTSAKEMAALGWDAADVILITGDAYIDHPSFGAAVIGRLLEAEGLRVAVLPQPNWRDDMRDFRKLGAPRLFFGVTAGAMDSMVNHYTAAKRLRSDDAYTPGGAAGFRPDRAAIVYTRILKRLYPDVPVVLGGIEASLRRFTHYDYWDDALRPSILVDSGADIVSYGMGEQAIVEIARNVGRWHELPQVAYLSDRVPEGAVVLHSFEECVADGRKFGENFVRIETESNLLEPGRVLVEPVGRDERGRNSGGGCEFSRLKPEPVGEGAQGRSLSRTFSRERSLPEAPRRWISEKIATDEASTSQATNPQFVVVNPPYPLMTTETLDRSFDLPYTRQPHPRYAKKGDIPAWAMIQNSINIHRGCFGGCSFCTISAHQGKFITSRSLESVLREVSKLTEMDYFRGNISDLGGPSANMYRLGGEDIALCKKCRRPSCLTPRVCANLNRDHSALLDLYAKVGQVAGVKKSYIGSGIRYDLFERSNVSGGRNEVRSLQETGAGVEKISTFAESRRRAKDYLREVVIRHTSGRLKVAPEHTEEHILRLMRKPGWSTFEQLHRDFNSICTDAGLKTQLIPYFISSHPGCTEADMRALVKKTQKLHLQTEQVQDFTPTPMTLASVMFHICHDPYTGEKLFVERNTEKKKKQKGYFLR